MSRTRLWWSQIAHERYWLEVTDRPDIGINLKAPIANEKGREFWGYSFLEEVKSGDIVFHYDKNQQAIVGRSVATGVTWTDVITWAARGTYARSAGIEPHSRQGLYLGLERYSPLNSILTLGEIRAAATELDRHLEELNQKVKGPLYYPFESGSKRETRPIQGYLFKLPAFFIEVFPKLVKRVRMITRRSVSVFAWHYLSSTK